MSDTNQFDERLFLALEAMEKLTERAEQSQATIEKLQATVTEQQKTIVTVANNKMTEINTTYKHVNEVMFQGVYNAVSQNIVPEIEKQIEKAINNNIERATSKSLNNLVGAIEERTGQVKDLVKEEAGLTSRVVFDASKELDQMTAKMEMFQNTLARKHYLLITLFGAGLFSFMCLFLLIFIKFGMPSASENQRLRLENNALQNQQAALISNIQRYRGQ